jgi:Right handed beta helix region
MTLPGLKTLSALLGCLLLSDFAQAQVALQTIDDSSSSFTYKSFAAYRDSKAYSKTAHGGQINGGSAEIQFRGSTLEVYAWKGADGGAIEIVVDGVSRGQVSLRNQKELYNQKVFAINTLSDAQHSLKIIGRGSNWNMFDYIKVGSGAVSTPTPTPAPTPVATPVATPGPTPVPTPVATPIATPVPTPVATPVATPAPTPVATPAGSAFYVSPTGNDSNAGSLAAPFKTLVKAQSAMRASSTIKTVYLRAGTYSLASIANCYDQSTCGLHFTSADNGQVWSYYPADGYSSAIVDGGSSAMGNGLVYVMALDNVSNITFDGFAIRNFQYSALGGGGGTGLVIKNMHLYNGTYVVIDDNPAAISLYGNGNATISHNVIHDMASWGIAFANVNGTISNALVDGNVVYNTCTKVEDCSAIYAIDDASSATNMRWTNNYVRDGNTFAKAGSGWGSGLYADDCVSNLTMSGNVLVGRNGSNGIHLHGGSNLKVLNNIVDLGTDKHSTLIFQTSDGTGCKNAAMSGVAFQSNIVIGNWSGDGGGNGFLSGTPGNKPVISGNLYHNYGSGTINRTDDYPDLAPVVADPKISGINYTVATDSPARLSPVNFKTSVVQYGYPGYVIPKTGSAPSVPQ